LTFEKPVDFHPQNRRRFTKAGFDLDLTYITDRFLKSQFTSKSYGTLSSELTFEKFGLSYITDRLLTSQFKMGWLRLVGSIKLQVSFAKEPYKRDDILQKRPVILSILLTVATP